MTNNEDEPVIETSNHPTPTSDSTVVPTSANNNGVPPTVHISSDDSASEDEDVRGPKTRSKTRSQHKSVAKMRKSRKRRSLTPLSNNNALGAPRSDGSQPSVSVNPTHPLPAIFESLGNDFNRMSIFGNNLLSSTSHFGGSVPPPTSVSVPHQSTSGSVQPLSTGGGVQPLSTGVGVPPLLMGGSCWPYLSTGGGVQPLSTGGGVQPLSTGGGVQPLSTGGGVQPLSTGGGVQQLSTGGGVAPLSMSGGVPSQSTGVIVSHQSTSGGVQPLPTGGGVLPLSMGGGLPYLSTGGGVLPPSMSGGVSSLSMCGSAPHLSSGGGVPPMPMSGGVPFPSMGGSGLPLSYGGSYVQSSLPTSSQPSHRAARVEFYLPTGPMSNQLFTSSSSANSDGQHGVHYPHMGTHPQTSSSYSDKFGRQMSTMPSAFSNYGGHMPYFQPPAPSMNNGGPSLQSGIPSTSFGANLSSIYGTNCGAYQNYSSSMPFIGAEGQRSMNAPDFNSRYASNANSTISYEQIAARHVMSKELPTFSGNPEEWPMFYSNFIQSTERCGFTDQENLIRLQRSLKGKALEAVRGKLMVPQTLPIAIENLRMLYGQPDVILQNMKLKLSGEPSVRAEHLNELVNLSLSVQNFCATVVAFGLNDYLRDPTLITSLVNKLPGDLRREWGRFQFPLSISDLTVFDRWLYDIARSSSAVPSVPANTTKSIDTNPPEGKIQKRSRMMVHDEANKDATTKKCPRCEKNHALSDCEEFKNINRDDRWAFIKQKRLCQNCFNRHHIRFCRLRRVCGVDGCRLRHSHLLHFTPGKLTKSTKNDDPKQSGTKTDTSTKAEIHCHHSETKTIFRIVPIMVHGPKGTFEMLAFIDEGSSVSLMEKEVASSIGLDGPSKDLCLTWTSDTVKKVPSSKILSFYVSAINGGPRFKLRDVRTMDNLNLPLQSLSLDTLNKYDYLKGIPIATYDSQRPKILIGLNNYDVCAPFEMREGGRNEPIASRSRLGWTLFGRNDDAKGRENVNRILHVCGCGEEDLHSVVKDFIFSDNLGVKTNVSPLMSKDNARALKIMEATTKRIGDCYETGLLWRSDNIRLPYSYPMAKRRLSCLESKMKVDDELGSFLRTQLAEYLEKGYIRKLRPTEISRGPRAWFLPIFTVKNPNKNKMRIVWDAAAKVDGVSLNSALLTGPDETRSLFGILLRFREFEIAICGDIEQMFHRVKIRSEDQCAQQFLWRDGDESREPDVYTMQVMTFGATCSPSLAQYVKNAHAEQYRETNPRAVEAIVSNHYVDDWLDSTRTEEQMMKLIKDVTKIHASGGFRIRNWISNSPRIRATLLEDSSEQKNFGSDSLTEKVLGLWWNSDDDHFTFKLNPSRFPPEILNGETPPTKRQVLRLLMTVFDPLGFLQFFLVHAKILLQDVWREGTDWDDQINQDHHEKWKAWTSRLIAIANVRVPRCFPKFNSKSQVQLHVFVDASIHAYATVTYLRVDDGECIKVVLIGSKSKVAPLKPTSIPRLELMAAVMGGRFAKTLLEELRIKITKKYFWSDSRNVLSWIRSNTRNFKQFVALRIAELSELSEVNEWRWLPSSDNVADEATKWSSTPEINPDSRWFVGPPFLHRPECEWPESTYAPDDEKSDTLERMLRIDVATSPPPPLLIDISRFSNWLRLRRCVAYVLRFVHNTRCKDTDRESGPLTFTQLQHSERLLFKLCQWSCFLEEMTALTKSPPCRIENDSRIRSYNPYVDEYGVLRVHGRIDSIEGVPYDVKRPIILSPDHPLTMLIVRHYHQRFYHHHHEIVVTELRQRFAIPRLRTVLRKVRSSCQYCKNNSVIPDSPQMSNLPHERLQPYTKPFTFTGVDHLGPVEITSRDRAGKRWIVLFTCLTTRAVHLEITDSLSTDAFLMNLKAFIARRGPVRKILSDQATNFRGANRELRAAMKNLDRDVLVNTFDEIEWHFNPPGAPHMGGVWERLVRSVKSCLSETFKKRYPSDQILYTTMAEIENIINSRPLTHVPLDHEDDNPITPNHFLTGKAGGIQPWGELKNDGATVKRNWRICEALANRFWKRWVREYLPTLTRRCKWFDPTKPIEINDVVVIVDENAPRNQWKKGVVIDINRGRGNVIRSAVVKTQGGLLTRPVVRLAVLDVKPTKL